MLQEAAELAAIIELHLDSSEAHRGLRARTQELRSSLQDRGAGPPPKAKRAPAAPVTSSSTARPSVGAASVGRGLVVALVVVAVLAGGRFLMLSTQEQSHLPTAQDLDDILPVQTLLYAPGHVTARLPPAWPTERGAPEEMAATALWARVSAEVDDPGLTLTLAGPTGTTLAEVIDGRVRWRE